MIELEPARVREHLADLERERTVQQAVAEALRDLADDADRAAQLVDRRITELRQHPKIVAAIGESGGAR